MDRRSRVRVLLADDNSDFLGGIWAWVAADPLFEIVGAAESAEAAIEQIERLAPDLVLMDATVPRMNGFEATRRIKASGKKAPLVVLISLHDSQSVRLQAAAAGADGFISGPEITARLMPLMHELTEIGSETETSDRSENMEGDGSSVRPREKAPPAE